LCLKRSWSDFDPQAYYLYGEDQNHETSFKGNALQAVVDSWCKIQVILCRKPCNIAYCLLAIGNRQSKIISVEKKRKLESNFYIPEEIRAQ